jgi:glycosyltransferase involved in cell wall biosynthesis
VTSVLAVTSQLPWPLDRGGHLRSFHLLRALARRFDVRLVAAVRHDGDCDLQAFADARIDVRVVRLPRRTPFTEAPLLLKAAFSSEPYVCFRRHDSTAVRAALQQAVAERRPDVLYLDHLDSLIYSDLAHDALRVVDLHNVYSTLVRRTADEASPLLRPWLKREARLLAAMERRAVTTSDAVLATSEEDRRAFERLAETPVHVVPNGVDCEAYGALPTGRPGNAPILIYIGALSWAPNAAAATFLATHVLPRVRAQVPGATLRIIGREPPRQILALKNEPGVEVIDNAPDVTPHLRDGALLAVPLESGGGSRLKILESFAAGLPVVSTPVGCEGLDVERDTHLLVAERDEVANAVVRMLNDSQLARTLAGRARDLVRRKYDWRQVGDAACDAVAQAV